LPWAAPHGDLNEPRTDEAEESVKPTTTDDFCCVFTSPACVDFLLLQFGDLTDGCTSAGPHFNPFGKVRSPTEHAEWMMAGRPARTVTRDMTPAISLHLCSSFSLAAAAACAPPCVAADARRSL